MILLFLAACLDRAEPCARREWPYDRDGDGLAGDDTIYGCAPERAVEPGGPRDCDDSDPDVGMGSPERCNGVDDDCDGEIDEDAIDPISGWEDADQDGYGGQPVHGCLEEGEYATVSGDCNDVVAEIHPGAKETCNSLDDDCDGLRFDGRNQKNWHADRDLDGWGDSDASTTQACDPGPGWAAQAGDCDDTDRDVHPEVYQADLDGDGAGAGWASAAECGGPSLVKATGPQDCDDANPDRYPGATERCENLVDEDCDGAADDGLWWPDADGDGWGDGFTLPVRRCEALGDEAPRGGDCDDGDPDVSPDAEDLPGEDLDRDCDGRVAPPMPLLGRYASQIAIPDVVALGDVDQDGLTDVALSTNAGAALLLGGDPQRYPWEADLLVLEGATGRAAEITLAAEDLVGGPTPDLVIRDHASSSYDRVFVVDGDRRGLVGSDQADAYLLPWSDGAFAPHLAGMGPDEHGGPALLALDYQQDVHLLQGPFEPLELLADERARLETEGDVFALDAPADFDGDGWRDLVVGVYDGSTRAEIVTDRPTGVVALEGIRIDLPAELTSLAYPGDFDGDGLADLASLHYDGAHLWSVAQGATPSERAAVEGVCAMAPAGDLDGDGAADALVVGTDDLVHLVALPSSGVWDLGASSATWVLPSEPGYWGWPLRAVGDTSGDGAPDFVVATPAEVLLLSP